MTGSDDRGGQVPRKRRAYARPARPKSVDAQERLNVILPAAVGFGFGGLVAWRYGYPFLLGAVLGAAFVALSVQLILAGAGRLIGGSLFTPSARSTPRRREYSAAEARFAAGDYDGAIAAYEQHVADDPTDPEPYLRIARIHRDQLGRYDEVAQWLTRARNESRLDAGRELFVAQELIELYLYKLRTPRKAIPELTLITRRFPDTQIADAAARDLEELRAMLAGERDCDLSLTQQFLDRRKQRREMDQT
ncbi:MAG: tetratricopeptide repeat protein [Gemmatimonadales bacterium]|jgi:tetratricopeptide (TPR) repeat protein